MRISANGTVSRLLEGVRVPEMFHARQVFPRPRIARADIAREIERAMRRAGALETIRPGMRVAITAGSRGIRNVDEITRSVVAIVQARGASAFIVPAMGSHGGATAQGQRELLAGFGITEQTMGCPILSSMETVMLGQNEIGRPVYLDKNACDADGIIVSCRLKPHNAFRGVVESGPCKMIAVGLGKQKGAEQAHCDGMGLIGRNLLATAKTVLESGKILFALPCLENAYDETMMFEAIRPENLIDRESKLLKVAFAHMPSILVGEGDVLIVDEIGKNYSGTGVDPNVTGTFSTPFATGGVKVQRTCFLNLSDCSHGNGLGVGLASAITNKIFDRLDVDAMYANCMTSTVLASAYVPCVLPCDMAAIRFCLRTLNGLNGREPRVIRISNSLRIGTIMLSKAYYDAAKAGEYVGLEPLDEPSPLSFDENGELLTP